MAGQENQRQKILNDVMQWFNIAFPDGPPGKRNWSNCRDLLFEKFNQSLSGNVYVTGAMINEHLRENWLRIETLNEKEDSDVNRFCFAWDEWIFAAKSLGHKVPDWS